MFVCAILCSGCGRRSIVIFNNVQHGHAVAEKFLSCRLQEFFAAWHGVLVVVAQGVQTVGSQVSWWLLQRGILVNLD